MSKPIMLLSLGCPLVDIIQDVSKEFLHKYNLKENSATSAMEDHKELFRELEETGPKIQAGGCSLNTVRVLQWILNVPQATTVVGAIGNDKHAELLKERLQQDGVTYAFEVMQEAETGKCAVLINGENRSLCTNLGASKLYKFEHLKHKDTWELVKHAQYYYVPGFFLGVSIKCVFEMAQYAASENKTFIFNLGAPFLLDLFAKEYRILAPFVDIMIGNESEAVAFAKLNNFSSKNIMEIAQFINSIKKHNTNNDRITIITRGSDSIIVAENNATKEYTINTIPPENIIDTNGAGDAFAGGFLAKRMLSKSLDECIQCGVWAATEIMQHGGCSFNKKLKKNY